MKKENSSLIKSCKFLFAIFLATPLIGFTGVTGVKIIVCNGRFSSENINVNKELKVLTKRLEKFKEGPSETSDTFVLGGNFIEQVAGGGYPNLKLSLCNSSTVIDTYSTKCLVQKNSRLLDEWLRLEQEDGAQRDRDMKSFYEKYEKDNVGVSSVTFIYLDKVNLTLMMDDISLEDYYFFRDKNGAILEYGSDKLKNISKREGIEVINRLSQDHNHWAQRGISRYKCELKKPKI